MKTSDVVAIGVLLLFAVALGAVIAKPELADPVLGILGMLPRGG